MGAAARAAVTMASRDRGPRRGAAVGVAAALLAVAALARDRDAPRIPFINDDLVVLDATRGMPFAQLWVPHPRWISGWWRPWSREFHTWALRGVFGPSAAAFHVVNLLLWIASLLLFHRIVRRWSPPAAPVATAGLAAMSAWGVPVLWASGAQELWMLVWALAAIDRFAAGRSWWAALCCALALLSKETAIVVPAVAVALTALVERRPLRGIVRTALPLALVVAPWALIHPMLGGRWLYHATQVTGMAVHLPPGVIVLRTVLACVNLDRWPDPEHGWAMAVSAAAPAGIALGILAWLGARATATDPPATPSARLALGGVAWAGLAWLPLLMPTIGWQAYYGLLGACGAWLALGAALQRRPGVAVTLVVALALVGGARAATVSRDWGETWYLRRAAEFLTYLRSDLLARAPSPAPGSRMYFTAVPNNVGFAVSNGAALRLWYGDPTLQGGLYRDYTPRRGDTGGDYFFRYDSTAGWVEVAAPDRAAAALRAADPRWREDAEMLAVMLSRAGDWPAAVRAYTALGSAWPGDARYPYYEGLAREVAGDSLGALAALERATSLPGADDEMRAAARTWRAAVGRRAASAR